MKEKVENNDPNIRIMIVDDHPMICEGIRYVLEQRENLSVVAVATNKAQALQCCAHDKPDIVILDISLKNDSGLDMIGLILCHNPSIRVIIHSMHNEALFGARARDAGACGYVMKEDAKSSLITAIQTVIAGQTYFKSYDPLLAQPAEGILTTARITPRETEILQLISDGKSTKQMAQALSISAKTVEVHRINIKKKLNISSQNELVAFAVKLVSNMS